MDLINYQYYNLVRKSELINSILSVIVRFEEEELYLTGGVLRNTIWNKLHNKHDDFFIDDCDIVFYGKDVTKRYEKEIERYLEVELPYINWSVKNQARMHLRNGHLKYKNLDEAIYCFPETSSAFAINGKWNIIAPYGYQDLLNLKLAPTTFCKTHEPHIFVNRLKQKKWLQRFNLLTLVNYNEKFLAKKMQNF